MALFNSNSPGTPVTRQPVPGSPAAINMVGEGTVIEGTLRAESDVRISGRVIGKVIVRGKVILAQEGSIDGELNATSADVAGSVEGELQVEERLVLKGTARIDGNIRTGRLVMEEGALFNGECQMGNMAPLPSSELRPAPTDPASIEG